MPAGDAQDKNDKRQNDLMKYPLYIFHIYIYVSARLYEYRNMNMTQIS